MVDDLEAEGPEFETLCSFTSRIGNEILPFALEMNPILNQVGLDSISTAGGDRLDHGVPGERAGLTRRPGRLSDNLGRKRKDPRGCGYDHPPAGPRGPMAQGATRLAADFSAEAQKLVMQVKGLDIICGDPRGIKAYGLTYAIASRGGDHLRAEPYFELTERKEEARQPFWHEKAADRLAEEGKAALGRLFGKDRSADRLPDHVQEHRPVYGCSQFFQCLNPPEVRGGCGLFSRVFGRNFG